MRNAEWVSEEQMSEVGGRPGEDGEFRIENRVGGRAVRNGERRVGNADQREREILLQFFDASVGVAHMKYSIACLLLAVSIATPVFADTDIGRVMSDQ